MIWKDINGWDGYYQVNTIGQVKSLKRTVLTKRGYLFHVREIILKPSNDKDGYPQVVFIRNQKRKTYKIHQLVAKTFISNPNNKPQINHKNGIKSDNCVLNLEWCTASENAIHTYTHLNRIGITYNKGKFGKNNPLSKIVVQINLVSGKKTIWHGITEASRETGIQRSKIGSVCNGRRKTAGGFKWKFA